MRFAEFAPVDVASHITVPILLIDAEKEHYFDIAENSGKVYETLEGKVPVEYEIFEDIGHYDIYRGQPLDRAMKLETAWFVKHLKSTD